MQLSDEMQRQAKALADGTRFRLFRHIVEADGPVGVADLTELVGFNHNAIRQHLAVLVDAAMVTEADEHRTTRGRPRKLYTARPDALSAFRSISGAYQRLSELLLQLATTDDGPYQVGFDAAPDGTIDEADQGDAAAATRALIHQLAVDGFEPSIEAQPDTSADATTVLGHCPFADVASIAPGVVCELHRGLIDGYLATHDPGLVGDLVVRNPHEAGCQVKVRSR